MRGWQTSPLRHPYLVRSIADVDGQFERIWSEDRSSEATSGPMRTTARVLCAADAMRNPRTAAIVVLAGLLLAGCPADMWIPVEVVPRAPVSYDRVAYLEAIPDRPYIVLGIITPPEDEYETEAEMVKAIRKEAGRHGADAIFIESQTEGSAWKFDSGILGAKGGSTRTLKVRAKAIAWSRDRP